MDKDNIPDDKDHHEIAIFKKFKSLKKMFLNLIEDTEIKRAIDKIAVDRYIKYKSNEENKTRQLIKWSFIIGVITAILAGDGVLSQIVVSDANEDIKQNVEWMRRIDNAIFDMRKYNQKGRLDFQRGTKINSAEFNDKRFEYRDEVARAYGGVSEIISQDVFDSGLQLIRFDESVKDIFAPNAPNDEAWHLYLTRNNYLIRLKIQEKKELIRQAESFILVRFFQNLKSWYTYYLT